MNNDKEKSWPLFRSFQGLGAGALRFDLVAGLTLAAIAIPEQMATAQLGGFPPRYRLFRLRRRLDRLRGVRLEPLSCRRAAGTSTITPIFAGALAAFVHGRRGGLRRARGRSRPARRPVFGAGRRVSGGLCRRSSVHPRDDRFSRGRRHPYRDLAGAGAAGPASAARASCFRRVG